MSLTKGKGGRIKTQIIIAKKAGACAGVKRALQLAYDCAEHPGFATTFKSLIHNPVVTNELQKMGVCYAQNIDEIDTEAVIIRSHGVSPDVLNKFKKKGLQIIDATCPNVTHARIQAQSLAKKYGIVVVVGDKMHPEVIGISGWIHASNGEVYVCKTCEDIPKKLFYQELGVVVQTTESEKNLKKILEGLERFGCKVHLKNTICHATHERQDAAQNLASRVDVMIVLGGRNSANTKRLTDICSENCKHVFLIQNLEELDAINFNSFFVNGKKLLKIGITAGASTPISQINACASKLDKLE